MLTLEKQLQLEGRLVRILVTALLLSWLCGLFAIDALLRSQNEKARAQVQKAIALRYLEQAVWVVEDERLALKTCYAGRWGTWRENVRHVDSAPERIE